MYDKAGNNALVEAANNISIDGENSRSEMRTMADTRQAPQISTYGRPDPDASPAEPEEAPAAVIAGDQADDKDLDVMVTKDPKPGSYEMMMRMFGPPQQPSPDNSKRVE